MEKVVKSTWTHVMVGGPCGAFCAPCLRTGDGRQKVLLEGKIEGTRRSGRQKTDEYMG